MPSKNSVKKFEPNQMWHVYNRGTFGRNIFVDERDYAVFLSYFKICLSEEKPSLESLKGTPLRENIINLRRLQLFKSVELISFCLMPNHFHLQLYQHDEDGISRLMRSVMTGYAMYYNRRYETYGHLFQGPYKASHINSDSYWHHISRYIHLNPVGIGQDYETYKFSSYKYFINNRPPKWLNPGLVLEGFKNGEYKEFCADYKSYKDLIDQMKDKLADK